MSAFLRGPLFFPCLIMALYVCSSVRYFFGKDFGRGMYWVCAFGITFTVTFLMKAKP